MITLCPVPHDDVRLGRLLQLYFYEWSGRIPVPLGEDGLFRVPQLEAWAGPDHDAVLFLDGARPLGFALVARDGEAIWHVEEFFVMLAERHRGLGAEAFAALTSTRPGPWTLTVRPENPGGLGFWRRILEVAPVPEVGDDGITRQRFTVLR